MRLDASEGMRITVRLFATLSRGRPGEEALEVDQDATVLQVMKRLGVPEGEVVLIFVNGRHAKPDLHLTEGDEVALVPPIGGG